MSLQSQRWPRKILFTNLAHLFPSATAAGLGAGRPLAPAPILRTPPRVAGLCHLQWLQAVILTRRHTSFRTIVVASPPLGIDTLAALGPFSAVAGPAALRPGTPLGEPRTGGAVAVLREAVRPGALLHTAHRRQHALPHLEASATAAGHCALGPGRPGCPHGALLAVAGPRFCGLTAAAGHTFGQNTLACAGLPAASTAGAALCPLGPVRPHRAYIRVAIRSLFCVANTAGDAALSFPGLFTTAAGSRTSGPVCPLAPDGAGLRVAGLGDVRGTVALETTRLGQHPLSHLHTRLIN